ncbi:MAG TPA: ATPase, T2SS/T4P/T4SS family, partial [Planctomycetia bacterium]|nr:ATPase, T2SS/T4P/T4SS family [Planctomycetia bacterium]
IWALDRLGRDATRHKVSQPLWISAILFGGVFSMVPLMGIKPLAAAAPFALTIFFLPTAAYVWGARNPRVPPDQQLLTDAHIANLWRETLTGFGFNVGGDDEDGAPRVRPIMTGAQRRRAAALGCYEEFTELLQASAALRATDIQADLYRDKAVLRYRVDGVWCHGPSLPRNVGLGVFQWLRMLSGMDGDERRRLQTGEFAVKIGKEHVAIQATSTLTAARERLVLRLAESTTVTTLDELMLPEACSLSLRLALRQTAGLIYVCGAPGSGRRTTLRACLAELDAQGRLAVFIDDDSRPPAKIPKSATRVRINPHQSAATGEALRLATQGSFDALVAGHSVDPDAVRGLVELSRTRLVLLAGDADGAVAGTARLLRSGLDPALVADRLLAAQAQRLPRKLCTACCEAYRPPPEALRRANLRTGGVEILYRARLRSVPQCAECMGIGYRGCRVIAETLPLAGRVRAALRTSPSERELSLEARREGMESISEVGLKLVLAGEISAEELRRVLLGGASRDARERVETS